MPKKLKDIPQKFHNMLQPKANTKPTESDFELIVPSPQFWNGLTQDEQNQMRQIVTEEGQDMDNYLYQMRRMVPRNPRGH